MGKLEVQCSTNQNRRWRSPLIKDRHQACPSYRRSNELRKCFDASKLQWRWDLSNIKNKRESWFGQKEGSNDFEEAWERIEDVQKVI